LPIIIYNQVGDVDLVLCKFINGGDDISLRKALAKTIPSALTR